MKRKKIERFMQILFKSNDFFEQNVIKNIWNIFDRFSGLVIICFYEHFYFQ